MRSQGQSYRGARKTSSLRPAHPLPSKPGQQDQQGDFLQNDDFISFGNISGDEDGNANGDRYNGRGPGGKRGQKRNIGQVLQSKGKARLENVETSTPWSSNVDWDRHASAVDQLTAEIKSFVKYIAPAEHEHNVRLSVIDDVRRMIMNRWRDASVYAFGSFETKLYLPTGDIDLVVMSPSIPSIKGQQRKILYLISSQLAQSGIGKDVVVIAKAKVPIVKFVSVRGNFKIDISLNMMNGLNVSQRVNQLFAEVGEDTARALVLIIKTFLSGRSMNEVYTGGLGSYSIICLVTSFLQLHPKLQKREINPWDNLGVLLLDFLEIYGKHFNYEDVGICLSSGGSYYSKTRRGWQRPNAPFLLSIEDPADPTNDVSGGSHNIISVRQSLAGAFEVLTASLYYRHSILIARIAAAQSNIKLPTLSGRAIPGTGDDDDEADECKRSLLGSILGATPEMISARSRIRTLAGLPDPPAGPPPKRPPSPSRRQPEDGARKRQKREHQTGKSRDDQKKEDTEPKPIQTKAKQIGLKVDLSCPEAPATYTKPKQSAKQPEIEPFHPAPKAPVQVIDLVTSSPEPQARPAVKKANEAQAMRLIDIGSDSDGTSAVAKVRDNEHRSEEEEKESKYTATKRRSKAIQPERVLRVIPDVSDESDNDNPVKDSDFEDDLEEGEVTILPTKRKQPARRASDQSSKSRPTTPAKARSQVDRNRKNSLKRIPVTRKALAEPSLIAKSKKSIRDAGSDMEVSDGDIPHSASKPSARRLSTQSRADYWSAKGPISRYHTVSDSDDDVVHVRYK